MSDSSVLRLTVREGSGSRPLSFRVRRMLNAGYVGRAQAAGRAQLEELRREGIPAPAQVPMLFPVLSDNITAADRIEVVGDRTSGEVEYVLLFTAEEIFVGVGSDHTDRELEKS